MNGHPPGVPPMLGGKGGHPSDLPMAAMAGDMVTTVLQRIRLSTWVAGLSQGSGRWSAQMPTGPGGFYAVLDGRLAMQCDGGPVIELLAGDAVVLTQGQTHVIGDDPASPRIDIRRLVTKEAVHAHKGLVLGDGEVNARFIGGFMLFDGAASPQLRSALPAMMIVRGSRMREDALVRTTIRMLEAQTRDRSPGTNAVMTGLVTLLFIEAARSALAAMGPSASGWVRALLDDHIGPVLGLIHASPGRDWTLAEMANEAGLSRTIFHERFTELVGDPPVAYLRDHRLQTAAGLMREGVASIAEIAARVGYSSQGAFCSAFKRWAKVTPGEYRARHEAMSEAAGA